MKTFPEAIIPGQAAKVSRITGLCWNGGQTLKVLIGRTGCNSPAVTKMYKY